MSICTKAGTPVSLRRALAAVLPAILMFALLALPTAASAHPPKAVTLAYDKEKGVLSVTIAHSSFFPSKHYVKTVAIFLNGKDVENAPYTAQPSGDSYTYTYQVKAAPGDELSATATCNIFGSAVGKVTVP